MLNRILQGKFYDAPDDNTGGQQDDHQPDDDKKPVDQNPDNKPGDDEPHKVTAKDQRRIRQDAINQFKDSDEFKQIIADTIAEGEKRAKMSADEKAEADRKAQAERDQQERDKFHREQAHFYAQQELANRKLPDTFADYVADQDRDKMVANVDAFEKTFNDAVHEETLKRMQGDQTPAAGNQTPNTTVTQKDWDAMSFTDQFAIQQKNPELAKQFMK
ncbi:DUF4355 domain-containing protein [Levilactobacillus spicheri]|uniref:Phage scaffold protein n=2 Tax=Levilactobacillus spicheri TaxID=216463 RepID=A0ABQ0WT80_9LACO|nr:DUF4355 domain-containing protein [Levilactobacillus spicheri]KRL50438.1 hypothetical protein FD37_GL002104 [Levilactobacillus spicheri DSM 15429]GEO67314.1 phage scaffold protein [Levilactobacillus spicheri]